MHGDRRSLALKAEMQVAGGAVPEWPLLWVGGKEGHGGEKEKEKVVVIQRSE